MNGFLFFFSLACQQIQCQEMERTEKRMAWPLDKRTKRLPLSCYSLSFLGEARQLRLGKPGNRSKQALYVYLDMQSWRVSINIMKMCVWRSNFFLEKRRRAALHYIKKKDGLRTLYNTHYTPDCLTDYIRVREVVVEATKTIHTNHQRVGQSGRTTPEHLPCTITGVPPLQRPRPWGR